MALQLNNPFKKNEDQLRAADGKFTSGSGGLGSLKNFNWKRSLPVVAVIALVGGLFVFRSFAGNALYSYQYSRTDCKVTQQRQLQTVDSASTTVDAVTPTAAEDDTCQPKSAEAMTYRMYTGILGREPDTAGYKYWVQKLAGDRIRPSEMAASLLKQKKVASLETADYIPLLYKQFLGKNRPDDKGLAFWTKHLEDKSWSRAKMATHFSIQKAAINKSQAGYNAYVAKAPAVTIKTNALNKQKSRENTAKQYATNAKAKATEAAKQLQNSKVNLTTAKSIASKDNPTLEDLNAIGDNQKTVENKYLGKAQKAAAAAKQNANKAQALARNATKVAKYSPDISDSNVKAQAEKAKTYSDQAHKSVKDLNTRIADIAAQYAKAREKYEAAQQAVADAQRSSSSGDPVVPKTVVNGLDTSKCRQALKDITQNSSKDCIAKLQVYGHIKPVDGIWGPITQAALAPFISANCKPVYALPKDKVGKTCVRVWVNPSNINFCKNGEKIRAALINDYGASGGKVSRYACEYANSDGWYAPDIPCPANYHQVKESQFRQTHCHRDGF